MNILYVCTLINSFLFFYSSFCKTCDLDTVKSYLPCCQCRKSKETHSTWPVCMTWKISISVLCSSTPMISCLYFYLYFKSDWDRTIYAPHFLPNRSTNQWPLHHSRAFYTLTLYPTEPQGTPKALYGKITFKTLCGRSLYIWRHS